MTEWVITDGDLWGKLTKSRRLEITSWLKMNGIDACNVPADCTVMIVESAPSVWEIWYQEYRRNERGFILVDPADCDSAFVRDCVMPLIIDPPMEWLIPALAPAAA